MSGMISNDRLFKILNATSDQQAEIDRILSGESKPEIATGPLLVNMTEGAKLLGLSRTCLWRILRAGRLKKYEIFPGSYRLRRADLLELVAGKKEVVHATSQQ